jgi:hypothetical protein
MFMYKSTSYRVLKLQELDYKFQGLDSKYKLKTGARSEFEHNTRASAQVSHDLTEC